MNYRSLSTRSILVPLLFLPVHVTKQIYESAKAISHQDLRKKKRVQNFVTGLFQQFKTFQSRVTRIILCRSFAFILTAVFLKVRVFVKFGIEQ